MNLFHRTLIGAMPYVPRSLIWRFSQRYIAGTQLQDAYRTVADMNAAGCSGTVDVLGEDSTSEEQVTAAVDLYLETLRGIGAASLSCPDCAHSRCETGGTLDASCDSCVAAVCAADSGIKSYLDLPLYCGQAAPALNRGA